MRRNGAKRRQRREGMLKIYMLMMLIGAIAAMSRLRIPPRTPQVTIRQPLECLLHVAQRGETSSGR